MEIIEEWLDDDTRDIGAPYVEIRNVLSTLMGIRWAAEYGAAYG
jgi:hypothetical protein